MAGLAEWTRFYLEWPQMSVLMGEPSTPDTQFAVYRFHFQSNLVQFLKHDIVAGGWIHQQRHPPVSPKLPNKLLMQHYNKKLSIYGWFFRRTKILPKILVYDEQQKTVWNYFKFKPSSSGNLSELDWSFLKRYWWHQHIAWRQHRGDCWQSLQTL